MAWTGLHYYLQNFMPEKRMPLWVVHIPAGEHHARCFHDHFHSELVIVLGGSGEHWMNGESSAISRGDVLLIHPGVAHGYDKTDDLELVNVIYDSQKLYLPVLDGYNLPLFHSFFPDAKEDFKGFVFPLLHLEAADLEQISLMIRQMDMELRENRSGNGLFSLALLMQIIVMLCRHGGSELKQDEPPFRIGEVIGYLNTHYHTGIIIDDLAHKVNMSRRNFFLIFKKTTGCTPIQYLIRLRIMHASELLQHTELSMTEIASKCGFSDSNYFCRKFRENTGLSPRQFRKNSKFAGPAI